MVEGRFRICQYPSEASLRCMILELYWEQGTTMLVSVEAPTEASDIPLILGWARLLCLIVRYLGSVPTLQVQGSDSEVDMHREAC